MTEKQFLVCVRCGEAFDNITSAHEHGTAYEAGMSPRDAAIQMLADNGWAGEDE